jgi:hypothetical protein
MMLTPMSDPVAPLSAPSPAEEPAQAEYQRRLEARQQRVAGFALRDLWISRARVLVFLGVIAACVAWLYNAAPALAIAPAGALFVALVVWHDRVLRAKARAARAVSHYDRSLARLDDRWAGAGVQTVDLGGAAAEDAHPYAADLDLFGHGSLFELLCGAQTHAGRATLARWLLAPATTAVVRARQGAVEDLRPRIDLREELALLGSDVAAEVHPAPLVAWSTQPPLLRPRATIAVRLAALALTAGVVLCGVLWSVFPLARWLMLGLLIGQWALGRVLKSSLGRVTAPVDQAERELTVLARVLARLEREPVTAAHLVELQRALRVEGRSAPASVRRLGQLAAWHSAQRNQLFAPIAFVLMWDLQLGLAIEGWRVRHGAAVERWLDTVGELEALCDLAGYAYEHSTDPFPELVEEGPLFHADDLGHPLLPRAECVRNSLSLGEQRVLVVSGSNMSGKSTLLRTVGANVVLAFAGAPVRATRLRLSALHIGATLSIHDSIQKGTSRFYSEIRRLHELREIARRGTLLFLLDEILHGTNSHDRRIGAEAVIRSFVAAGGIGLVTTHDLALTEIVDSLGVPAANVHFVDELEEGELRFDYRMHPGVVRRSNALALMRSVGIEV